MAIANDTCRPAAGTLPVQESALGEPHSSSSRDGGLPRHLFRLYRAHISPAFGYGAECTAFVEAASHRAAIRKIANTVAALETRLPDQVEERIYNCYSARELIDDGFSEDVELRLFETGWGGNKVVSWVRQPLFLLAAPAELIRKWARISSVEVFHD
jgi:hypothetical protein